MTREFVRLFEFEKQCKQLGLDDDDIADIEGELLDNPAIGVVIQGTGGIRKMRIKLPAKGKSGGARVVYVDFVSFEKIYLLTAYGKTVKQDITQSEKKELKKLVNCLESELRKKGSK